MSKMNIDTIGTGTFYKNLDIPIPNTLTADYFEAENIHQQESNIVRERESWCCPCSWAIIIGDI